MRKETTEQILSSSSVVGAVGLFEDILGRGVMLRVRVTGKSVTPFVKGEEVLTIRKVPGDSLRTGDVILFKKKGRISDRPRIARIKINGHAGIIFQTKGDALTAPDEPVRKEHILGKVCRVENRSENINLETGMQRSVNYLVAAASLFEAWLLYRPEKARATDSAALLKSRGQRAAPSKSPLNGRE
ncbi:MAG TPA: hypothetical protein DCP92_06515 [Nitrospiraceae bacterium]|nr:hypothetical protein [Nitrospiraceae bacterium]